MRIVRGKQAAAAVAAAAGRASDGLLSKEAAVRKIVADVKSGGESAIRKFAEKYDGLSGDKPLRVCREEMREAWERSDNGLKRALQRAAGNIRRFAGWQMPRAWSREIEPGVRVGQMIKPLASVGCYVPGGRYPLPSTLLMTVIPAQAASVPRIVVASPRPAAATLAAAHMLGVTEFYRVGGAQAVAALAYGCTSIARVDKIVGPGNNFVTEAKRQVSADPNGCAIEMLAGPTEAVIISESGDAKLIAADLVAQAEHDCDAFCAFITTSVALASAVSGRTIEMARKNPMASASLENGFIAIAENLDEAIDWANQLAAEHLTVPNTRVGKRITATGSLFLGDHSAQPFGDYVSGPNHVLPTCGAARWRGGLSASDFVKVISTQEVTKDGARRLAKDAETIAHAEGLPAHAFAARARAGSKAKSAGGAR